jgi:pimeloyl-ACP methyl ester carboxylesterase
MKKKNIVLLHGWGANTKKLGSLKEKLQDLDWKVFVPKLPGFDIKPPKDLWGVNEYANYVREESKRFFHKEKYFVFGHSFGGRLTIRIAVKNPAEIEGIILCSSSGLSRPLLIKRVFFFILAKIGKIFLFFKPIADKWKKLIYKSAREHDYEKAQGIMKEIFKKIIRENQKIEVLKISVPTLVLWGSNDKTTPIKDAYFLSSKIRHSKLIMHYGVGHRLPYENFQKIAIDIEKWVKTLN